MPRNRINPSQHFYLAVTSSFLELKINCFIQRRRDDLYYVAGLSSCVCSMKNRKGIRKNGRAFSFMLVYTCRKTLPSSIPLRRTEYIANILRDFRRLPRIPQILNESSTSDSPLLYIDSYPCLTKLTNVRSVTE